MNTTTLLMIGLLLIFGIFIVIAIIKKLIRVAIIIAVIYVIFQVGFVWSTPQLMKNLHIQQIFSPAVSHSIQNGYQQFSKDRGQTAVINAKHIDSLVNQAVQTSLKQGVNSINKLQLETQIRQQLANMSSQAAKQVVESIGHQLKTLNINPLQLQK
jgi:hypothetical protein